MFKMDLLPSLFLGGILCFLALFSKKSAPPHLKYSLVHIFTSAPANWRVRLDRISGLLTSIALVAMLVALANPTIVRERIKSQEPYDLSSSATEGIGIYLVLDQSGSMRENISRKTSKMSLLKEVTRQFIEDRTNDLIGLIGFARGAKVFSPETLDHQAVLKELSSFDAVKNTNEDGTAIGYALYKAGSLISAMNRFAYQPHKGYNIKSQIIILVTDGLQDPNPLDKGKRFRNIEIDEAGEFLAKMGIKLYTIIIEPKLNTEEYAPYRRLMSRVSEKTGGKFYILDEGLTLQTIYKEIDQLEKSKLPFKSPHTIPPEKILLFPYLIVVSLILLMISIVSETVIVRKFP